MVPGQRRLFKLTLILMEVLVAKFGRPSLVPSNHTSSLCLSFCWPTSPVSLWFLSSPFCGDFFLLESHCLSRPASLPGQKVASSHSYFGSLPGTWVLRLWNQQERGVTFWIWWWLTSELSNQLFNTSSALWFPEPKSVSLHSGLKARGGITSSLNNYWSSSFFRLTEGWGVSSPPPFGKKEALSAAFPVQLSLNAFPFPFLTFLHPPFGSVFP